MKKVDFHIHTVATPVDVLFEFDIAKLKEYVDVMGLNGIAITNHNMFDLAQFRTIANTLGDIAVLPGIEINIGAGPGHLLLIGDNSNLEDFNTKCQKIADIVKIAEDSIDIPKLREIFGDLSQYLLVPHYDKRPPLDASSINLLEDDFVAGEVMSAKKFMYAIKDDSRPTPLLFSDGRAKADWNFKSRQTYLDLSTVDIRSIKMCLADKNKVALSKEDGHELIQVTPEGVTISSGLTVVLGGRSSGKSYTLDQIVKYNDDVRYIRQFELIEADPDKAAKEFNDGIGKKQRADSDRYLKEFRGVIDDIKNISLKNDDRKIEDYLSSLLKSASEAERQDLYSKAALYSEVAFQETDSNKLKKLIDATDTLLNPGVYAELVNSKVSSSELSTLFVALVDELRKEALTRRKYAWVNELVRSVKQNLNSLSAATQIKDVDLLEIAKNKRRVSRFCEITEELKKPRTIDEKNVQRFVIKECSVAIRGAQDLKDISGRKASFADAFSYYDRPYDFLLALQKIEEIDSTAYYRFFTKIEYRILNEYGVAVSGGERAEFRLINKINGAAGSDMLLIDEPESSFDNIFLSSDVNQVIKEISKNTPVVIVTHNNTVGASIKPDYLIYTERIIVDNTPQYRIYAGRTSDRQLVSRDGQTVSNAEVTLKYLEAGKSNYEERGRLYAMLED